MTHTDPEHSGDETPKTTLEQLTDQERAVWSHLHGEASRRGRLQPLTPAERAEFAPFAAVLARARDAGFRPRHLVTDARDRQDQDVSELKMFREPPDGPTEVIVFCSQRWAQAFRVRRGEPLFGAPELEEEPARLVELVLAGTWPKEDRANAEDQQAAVQAWVEQLQRDGYATTERLADRAGGPPGCSRRRPGSRRTGAGGGWVQSPSDGLWHGLRLVEERADVEGEGVAAACGHRIPSATHAEEQPGHPACLDCARRLVGRLRNAGWSM